jgi:hypothetical protein
MCRWVYAAGSQRLAHLSLMRPSAASRRFARLNALLLALTAAVAVFANTGWHVVQRGPGIDPTKAVPAGKGWGQVVARPPSLPVQADRVTPVSLWWNLPWAAMMAPITLVLTLATGLLLVWIIGRGSQRALRGASAGTPRLRCAVHYGTAGVNLVALALAVSILRPLGLVGQVRGWTLLKSPALFNIVIVLLALVGLASWWFWLIRLAETTPKETRRTASRYFVAWAPLWAVVLGGGVAGGIYVLMHRLGEYISLAW